MYASNSTQVIEMISKQMTSLDIIHRYSENHILLKCRIKDILSIQPDNWEYNRPPDMIRCQEIASYVYDKRPELDWLFYMIYENNAMKIIDGIHRYNALQLIQRENQKPADYLTPNAFGCNGNAEWLYEKYVLISLRLHTTMGENVDLFQSLNKSNPVPELYMENRNTTKREIIEKVVHEWVSKYKSHFSANPNPRIPNMNRDRFIELCDAVYEKYKINKSNGYLLSEKLYDMNHEIRTNPPKKMTQKTMDKCEETGCYLFLHKKETLEFKI